MKNKGQVTLFVIVGVSLILAFSILFYIMLQTEPDLFEEAQDTSLEKNSLQIFIESCLQRSSDEALEIIRLQGGYIKIPSNVETIDLDSNLTVVNGRLVKEKGKVKVPYYLVNNELSVPSLELIEDQFEEFVNERVYECIDDFSDLKDQGYNVVYGDINSNVVFDINTLVDLDFSVNVSRGDNSLNEERFGVVIPINFRDLYRKALKVTMHEFLDGYLERHAKRLISLYSFNGGDDSDALPPFGLTLAGFSCERKTWSQEEAKQTLQKVFKANYPHLKIARLNYTKYVLDDEIAQGVYDSFVEDILEKDLSTHLDISYEPEWGMDDFNVEPSSGGTIEPDEAQFQGIPMLAMLCSLKYNFKYTFRNPILFEMWDEDNDKYLRSSAPQGEKFKYRFFMESYMCGNRVKECTGKSSYAEEIQKIKDEYFTFTSICDNKNSGDVLLIVMDPTNMPLSDVSVAYYCGNDINDCSLGVTNSQGELSTRLPYCENGILTFNKQGYYDLQQIQSIRHGFDRRYTYKMVPEAELDYNVSLIRIKDFVLAYELTSGFSVNTCDGRTPEDVFNSLLHEPSLTDVVTINMRDPRHFFSPTFSVSAGAKLPPKANMPPANYDVSMNYMGVVTIKPVMIETEVGEDVEISLNENGGDYKGVWILGNNNFEWNLDEEDLENKKEIEFFVLANYLPGDDINVNSIKQEFINENGLMDVKVTIPANSLPSEGCSNAGVSKNVLIPLSRYEGIIEPRLK